MRSRGRPVTSSRDRSSSTPPARLANSLLAPSPSLGMTRGSARGCGAHVSPEAASVTLRPDAGASPKSSAPGARSGSGESICSSSAMKPKRMFSWLEPRLSKKVGNGDSTTRQLAMDDRRWGLARCRPKPAAPTAPSTSAHETRILRSASSGEPHCRFQKPVGERDEGAEGEQPAPEEPSQEERAECRADVAKVPDRDAHVEHHRVKAALYFELGGSDRAPENEQERSAGCRDDAHSHSARARAAPAPHPHRQEADQVEQNVRRDDEGSVDGEPHDDELPRTARKLRLMLGEADAGGEQRQNQSDHEINRYARPQTEPSTALAAASRRRDLFRGIQARGASLAHAATWHETSTRVKNAARIAQRIPTLP